MRRRRVIARVVAALVVVAAVGAGTTEARGGPPAVDNPGARLVVLGGSLFLNGPAGGVRADNMFGGALAQVASDGSMAAEIVDYQPSSAYVGPFYGSAEIAPAGTWSGTVVPDTGVATLAGNATVAIAVGPAVCTVGPFSMSVNTATPGSFAYYPGTGMARMTGTVGDVAPVVPTPSCPEAFVLLLNATLPAPGTTGSTITIATTFLPPMVGPGGIPVTTTSTSTTAPPPTTTTLDPALAQLSVGDATVIEPDGSSQSMQFVVTRSGGLTGSASATYTTVDGTAFAPVDYTIKTGTVSFSSGQTSKIVSVAVKGDVTGEPDETFDLELVDSSATAVVLDSTGTGTIADNDPPGASIDDVEIDEPPRTSTTATFTVTLSRPATQAMTVSYRTRDVTAAAPADYVAKTSSVSIAAGKSFATFKVTVKGDLYAEDDELFVVELTGVTGGSVTDGTGIATIFDDGDSDDPPAPRSTTSRSTNLPERRPRRRSP